MLLSLFYEMKIVRECNRVINLLCFILLILRKRIIIKNCLILSICSSAFKLRAGPTSYGNEVASCSNDCLGGSPL